MILKKLHTVLFLFIFAIFSFNLKAQDLDLINTNILLINSLDNSCDCDCSNTLDISKPFYNGNIILNDDTVLNGQVSINHLFNNNRITIYYNDNTYEPIDNDLIKEVNISHQKNEIISETTFFNLNNDGKLYRLVYQKDSEISVYDSSTNPEENSLIGRVYVKENDTIIDTWNFWSSGSKKDLINYLNDRDGTNYKRRDFKSLDDLFSML